MPLGHVVCQKRVNSAKWTVMLDTLEHRFRIRKYMLQMIREYLSDRTLLYDTEAGSRIKEVTAGAAQGQTLSGEILRPNLWNASYDGILWMGMAGNTFLVKYANDIEAVIIARYIELAQMRLRQVIPRVMLE